VLAGGRVIADGPVKEVMRVDDPWLQSYFRVRTMLEGTENNRGT
jgi:ABC-type transporter Mla maintaining outer membrane lipid asymmetry ATPase subunit MlaF